MVLADVGGEKKKYLSTVFLFVQLQSHSHFEVFTVPHVFHLDLRLSSDCPRTLLGLFLSEITAKQVQVQS